VAESTSPLTVVIGLNGFISVRIGTHSTLFKAPSRASIMPIKACEEDRLAHPPWIVLITTKKMKHLVSRFGRIRQLLRDCVFEYYNLFQIVVIGGYRQSALTLLIHI
jgi:hypothetical protein